MIEKAKQRIKDIGVSVTQTRVRILAYLMEHHTHPDLDEIYQALVVSMPTLSRTSVYNTVHLLNRYGLVKILTIDGRQVCVDEDTSAHAHLLCTRCGKVIDMPLQGIDGERQMIVEGNLIEEVHQYYKGICKNCLTKKD